MAKSKSHLYYHYSLSLLFIIKLIVSLHFFNSAGIDWMMYSGFVLIVIGFSVFGGMARYALKKNHKRNDWRRTKFFVRSGIYSIVRHPLYISFVMYAIGLLLISQHWLNLGLSIPLIGLFLAAMIEEEEDNIRKFGHRYRRYMNEVPRINFIAGIIRHIKRRR